MAQGSQHSAEISPKKQPHTPSPTKAAVPTTPGRRDVVAANATSANALHSEAHPESRLPTPLDEAETDDDKTIAEQSRAVVQFAPPLRPIARILDPRKPLRQPILDPRKPMATQSSAMPMATQRPSAVAQSTEPWPTNDKNVAVAQSTEPAVAKRGCGAKPPIVPNAMELRLTRSAADGNEDLPVDEEVIATLPSRSDGLADDVDEELIATLANNIEQLLREGDTAQARVYI